MKTRIIALILTVVMVLLALTSCTKSYDIARDNLDTYADFNLDDFLKALQNIELDEDGTFTTDEATRNKIVAAKVYNTILDKLVGLTDTDDHKKDGELTAGDILYFVYYAVDADNNEYFGGQMSPSMVTDKNNSANHVVRLGDNFEVDGKEFWKLIAENLKEGKIEDYLFSSLTATELKNEAVDKLLEKNPNANTADKDAAGLAATKLNAGDKVYISFTRTYETEKEDGTKVTHTEKATYTLDILDAEHPLYGQFFADGATANVGSNVIFGKDAEGKNVTTATAEIDGVTYTYSNVKAEAKVVSMGDPIASFEYTPYDTDDEKTNTKVAPSSTYTVTGSSVNTVDLRKKSLTYHIYPVYYIDAPTFEDITAFDILYYLNGSKLVKTSYKTFKTEGYKNGDDTLEDLLKDITFIYDSTLEGNDQYGEGTALKKALDEYDAAVKAGGAKPTDEQKTAINEKNEALTDAKDAALKEVLNKIVAAKATVDGAEKTLGTELRKEYVDGVYHTEKTTYDGDIQKKVEKAVLDLIYESVTIKKYPENLLKEFKDHIYEEREYEFYTGTLDDKKTSNFEEYGSLDNYLKEIYKQDKSVDAGIEREAKEYLDPIIKIFLVSQKLENKAKEAMPGFIQADIDAGLYDDEIEDNAEYEQDLLDGAKKFIIDDAFMKDWKGDMSSSAYNELINTYGELNIKTLFQFQKLFAYLTSVEHVENKTMETTDIKYNEAGTLAFRVLSYKIVEKTEEDATEEDTNK